MTLTHLHLLLNHVPTVGVVVAVGLLLLAFARRDEGLKRAGLEVLFVIALLTLPVYTSGVAAQREIREMPEVSDTAMKLHQDAALYGFVMTEFAGFVAWVALWQSRRRGRSATGLVVAATVLSALSLAIMGRAANLGGDIRHPEIRADLSAAAALNGAEEPAPVDAEAAAPSDADAQAPRDAEEPAPSDAEGQADDPNRYLASAISDVMVNSRWVWPAAEAVHFLGLSLSLGVLLGINLRILGVMRRVPFAEVHRWLPWGMLGFGANLITGMLFFVGQPAQYIESAPFYWKVIFLMIAGANFLYLTVFNKGWDGDRLDSSLADKGMAIVSIASWFAVLYAGRMLPFLGNAF